MNLSKNALVVDDSRAMRRLIGGILEQAGIEVKEAANGEDALALVDGDIDFALVDWNMPVMNGLEFVESVRERTECDEIRLVMVTSETEPSRIARALLAGADEYVMKPFSSQVLLGKLETLGLLPR